MPTQTFFNLPEDKKDQIIEAAVDDFFEKGYEKMSIAKMIEKAKIPRGSFYQYFEDKQDLYKYIIINIIGSRKHHHSNHIIAEMGTMSLIDIVRELFLSGINFYRNEPKLASIATEFLSIKDVKLKKEILGDSQKVSHSFFKNLIDDRKMMGEISQEVDTEMLIYLINTINSSFAQYFIENKDLSFESDDLINFMDRMLSILENGIKSKE